MPKWEIVSAVVEYSFCHGSTRWWLRQKTRSTEPSAESALTKPSAINLAKIKRSNSSQRQAHLDSHGVCGGGDIDAGVPVIQQGETAVEVGQAESGYFPWGARDPSARIFHDDHQLAGLHKGIHAQLKGSRGGGEAVLDGVLDERLHERGWRRDLAGFLRGIDVPVESLSTEASGA